MNRGDAPEWKRAIRPQALGELIGEEIVGPSDSHGRRKYSAWLGHQSAVGGHSEA